MDLANLLVLAFHRVLDCACDMWHRIRALLQTRYSFFQGLLTIEPHGLAGREQYRQIQVLREWGASGGIRQCLAIAFDRSWARSKPLLKQELLGAEWPADIGVLVSLCRCGCKRERMHRE